MSLSWCLVGWSSLICMAVRRPSNTSHGTMMYSVGGNRGSFILTTKSPSLEIVATLRYHLMSLMCICLLDGLVPCLRWAQTHCKSGYANCVVIQAFLLAKGTLVVPLMMPWIDIFLTTVFWSADEGTYLVLYREAIRTLRLAKSLGMFTELASWRTLTWYQLTIDKKDVRRGLDENSSQA